jgi:hypothetical protein
LVLDISILETPAPPGHYTRPKQLIDKPRTAGCASKQRQL